jgi:putative salt-induced outer membrane protein YdiY
MKKLLLALLISTATLSCSKSNNTSTTISASQVPSPVMSSFNAKYPTASGQIEWEKEDSNTYKVKFYIGSQRWQAIFKADGTFVSEQKI